MGEIIVAYARADEASAQRVMKKLESIGFAVRPAPAGAQAGARRIRAAEPAPALVLWSKNFAAAQRGPAQARGARIAARLDSAPLPMRMRIPAIDLRGWRGREDHRGWKRLRAALAAGKPAPQGPRARFAASAPPAKAKKAGAGPALLWLAGAAAAAAAGGAAALMTMH